MLKKLISYSSILLAFIGTGVNAGSLAISPLSLEQALNKKQFNLVIVLPHTFSEPEDLQAIEKLTQKFYHLSSIFDKNATALTITIIDSGTGGSVNSVIQLGQSILTMRQAGIRVVFDVSGAAYSGHAFITCYGDQTNIRSGAGLMFHAAGAYFSIFGPFGYKFDPNLLGNIASLDSTQEAAMYEQCLINKSFTTQDLEAMLHRQQVVISVLGQIVHKQTIKDTGDLSDALEGGLLLGLSYLFMLSMGCLILYCGSKSIKNGLK